MSSAVTTESRNLGQVLSETILAPMKQIFVGKDEIIDLLGICLVARENLFILGPPGTAKSALVQQLAGLLERNIFDYLLTRFTEPNEIFGPFDIRKLREGELVTNTQGMLPEADFVFFDELLNANSAILNSLLLVLNERIFRRGRETRTLPTLMVVGASNRLPEDDALRALFDRFLLRVYCDNVPVEELASVLQAGWILDTKHGKAHSKITVDDVQKTQSLISQVELAEIRTDYVGLIQRLRHAGIAISDRRAVKLQRLMAASALLCGRLVVQRSDFWILRYIWDTQEQQDVLTAIVNQELSKIPEAEQATSHPRSRGIEAPNPEHLASDLDRLAAQINGGQLPSTELSYIRDQLGLLTARCQWVSQPQQKSYLESKIEELWKQLER